MSPLRRPERPFDDRGSLGGNGADPAWLPERVGVVFGGPSPEHDVSILTGLQAARALGEVPGVREVVSLYWAKTGEWFSAPSNLEASAFMDGPPKGATGLRLSVGAGGGFAARKGGLLGGKEDPLELDAVVNCCHGGPGEDGTLQGVLDLCGLAYTGPSLASALVGMDKLAFSALMAHAFLPMLPRMPLLPDSDEPDFSPPYIVKPRFGGSSIGIDVVADFASALARLESNPHLRRGAVLEPYQSELFDVQVGVRSWPKLELSAIERPLRTQADGEILAYADKYVGEEGMTTAPRELPADLPDELAAELRRLALEVASLCGVRGVARIDFLSDGEALLVNEINTIPGSLARHLFVDPPLAFPDLLADLLAEAAARPAASFSSAGADGSVLRVAGSIGGKLA